MKCAWHVARLALADIKYEWRMSLCLILAVAAIASPLLLFFGLKTGTVDTLRQRLLDNPVTLEILPNTEKLLDHAWFDRWDNDPRVAFVVPHTRKLSAQADLVPSGKQTPRRPVDIRPTKTGDILLAHYGASVPKNDQCVLTARAAQQLGVQAGDTVDFIVSRDQGRVHARHTFAVLAVLPIQATTLPAAYIPLRQLEWIEAFKDGRSVPEFGWPGAAPLAQAVTKRILLLLPDLLDPLKRVLLLENTGFASLSQREPGDAKGGIKWHSQTVAYFIESRRNPAEYHNIEALKERLRGLPYTLVPLPNALQLRSSTDGESFDLELAPATALDVPLPLFQLPMQHQLSDWASFDAKPLQAVLVHPSSLAIWKNGKNGKNGADTTLLEPVTLQAEAVATASDGQRSISFPVRLIPEETVPKGMALAPQSLLGVLNTLADRPLESSLSQSGEALFLLGRRGYSGFRMYASGLEQVAPLAEAIEAEGIIAKTRADRIAEVQMFDKYLGMLFWIIALASFIGGLACLVSNVYANVERKRREFAVLRLLGVHGLTLALFPLVSVMVLTFGGMLGSLVLFHAVSRLINTLFSSHLEAGEAFCQLTVMQQCNATGLALIMAVLAGLAAAKRLASIEPAESLRAE